MGMIHLMLQFYRVYAINYCSLNRNIVEIRAEIPNTEIHTTYHVCAATLIDNLWALSAAHCWNASVRMNVWAGHSGKIIVVAAIKKTFIHPGYDVRKNYNDIALYLLENRIEEYFYIRHVVIPRRKIGDFIETNCFMGQAKGWQRIAPSQIREQCVSLSLIEASFCGYELADKILCVNTSQDICLEDSGGPLLCGSNLQIGIITRINFSLEHGSCSNPPNAFPRIDAYVDFINEILDANNTPEILTMNRYILTCISMLLILTVN